MRVEKRRVFKTEVWMRFTVTVASILSLLWATPAHATKMSGKVSISKAFIEALEKAEEQDSKGAKDYYWKLPNGIIPVSPPHVDLSSDIAVVLFKDDAKESTPDNKISVTVETGKLERNVIVTRPGSTIKFTNESPFVHELYAPDLPSFKPEAQSKGAFRPIEFKNEGIFEVRCKRMPNFLGYVVVTTGKDLELKKDGTFSSEIEPGKYTLKVFHNGAWIHKQSFTAEDRKMDPLSVKLETPNTAKKDDKKSKSNGKKDGE
jgi:plastocyanin